jgi:hypothetical protein
MCTVKDCDRPRKAKGLCATHYQRWRRTGDPEEVRRAGRPRDQMLERLREEFSGKWNPRTITRYKRALAMLWAAGCTEEEVENLSAAARIANGKPNVACLERLAKERVFTAVRKGRLEVVDHQRCRIFVGKRQE